MTAFTKRSTKGLPLTTSEMDANWDLAVNNSEAGSITWTAVSTRLSADLSNATIANRLHWQTSTVNGTTWVGTLPNGTATTSGYLAHNNSTPTNASIIYMYVDPNYAGLVSATQGSGTVLPLKISSTAGVIIPYNKWDIKTGAYSIVAGDKVLCNTTSGAFALTLPTPAVNMLFSVADYAGTFGTNNLTINPGASYKIMGQTNGTTLVLDINNFSGDFVYIDTTQGWRLV